MSDQSVDVIVGVDTHTDTHTAVAVDLQDRRLGELEVAADSVGYRRLLEWANAHGTIHAAGVEGTGSYGAGLTRFLTDADVTVIEVGRPNRQHRRRYGKSDPADAEGAARAVLSGQATSLPKSRDGIVESIRTLHVVKRSAMKARTQASNQMTNLIAVGAPTLLAELGVKRDVATKLLIAAGDNPDRIRTQAGFAALCGVNPVAASSGRTTRHRLNRSGDRQANNAPWTIARVRLSHDPTTRAYAERRTNEGLSHREIIRCLKRYLARQLHPIIVNDLATLT